MQPTTSGVFRVLADPHGEGWLLVDPETADTIAADGGADLEPGNLIEATVKWDDGDGTVAEATVLAETWVWFADGITGLFEVARDLCEEARLQGEGIVSETTYSTDGEPNGAVYAFAEQPGERDLYEEFQTGAMPLEPLIDRLSEDAEEPYEVFVLRPVEEPFVIVYLVRDQDSMLASTVRDTYL